MKHNIGRFIKGRDNPNKILPILSIKYGNLKVISEEIKYSNDNRSVWTMQCSCGEVQDILAKSLRRTKSPRTSCSLCARKEAGILRMMNQKNHKKRGSHSGVGDLTRTQYLSIKRGAIQRNILFDVSIEFLWKLYLEQGGLCKLSCLPIIIPELITVGKQSRSPRCDNRASVDRIDSSMGYTETNVQWVHKDINIMKNSHEQNHFINLCRLIVNNHDNPEPSHSNMEGATTRA